MAGVTFATENRIVQLTAYVRASNLAFMIVVTPALTPDHEGVAALVFSPLGSLTGISQQSWS
jgi:hypothetical protein